MYLRAASSSSCGLFVAAITITRSVPPLGSPSNSTRNSVFRRREASCSPEQRSLSSESTSSIKMMAGCSSRAIWNRARTIFSPSPTYFEVRVAAEMEKKVAEHSAATQRASKVLPEIRVIKIGKPLDNGAVTESAGMSLLKKMMAVKL